MVERSLRLAIAIGLVALTFPASARAYCRTTTVGVDPEFTPTTTSCWDQGLPLFWRTACVGYDMQQNASSQVSLDDAEQTMATAFAKWTSTTCPAASNGASRVSIDVRDLGPVACDQVQYNKYGGNANVIMFDDSYWPHDDVNNTLALTTVTFDKNTGELIDADMEINTFNTKLALDGTIAPGTYDFLSIVTHESGHFLGMAHSGDSEAVMYAHYDAGASLRNLTEDDISGICSIYSPDGTRNVADGGLDSENACDPTPSHGFASACGTGDVPPKTSCRVASVGEDANRASGAPALVALLGFVGIAWRRRRARIA